MIETLQILGLFLAASFWSAEGTGTSCQDIDHDACVAMGSQNPNICSAKVLANTACPAYCKKCPLTCYNCNTTTPDVSQCNTVTCAKGEMCLLKTVSGIGNTDKYKMMCGAQLFCSSDRKRNQQFSDALGLQSRGTSIDLHCCDSDLCNSPQQTTATTKQTTAMTSTTTTTTTTTTATTTSTTSGPTTRQTVSQTSVYHHGTHQTTSCRRDIIIMLEDSLDMAYYFDFVKSALADLLSHLDIGPHETRVGLGTFRQSGKIRWNLDSHMDKASLLSAVIRLSHQDWASNAVNAVAVETVLQNFSQGNRPAVPDDVIFITEGHTPHWYSQNKFNAAIQSLHQKSNNVIAIALGAVNQNEMHQIATDNKHYFYIKDILHYNPSLVSNVSNLLVCK